MQQNSQLVDISSAAKMLGVSKLTLRNWDNLGIIKAVRIGNRQDRRYYKKELEFFLSNLKQMSKPVDKKELEKYIDKNEFWTQEGPVLPITIEVGAKKITEIEKHIKPGIKFCICILKEGYGKWLLSTKESIENCKAQLKIYMNSSKKSENLTQMISNAFEKAKKELIRFEFIKTNNLSKENLLKEFNNLVKVMDDFWSVTMLIEPYSPFLDQYSLPKFQKIIKDIKKANNAFAKLTLPIKISFVVRERKDIIRMILKYLQKQKDRDRLKESYNIDYLAYIKINNPEFFEALLKHQRDYYWTQNNYHQRIILGLDDFLDFIRELTKSTSLESLKQEYEKFDNENLVKEQETLIKELNLEKNIFKELEFIREITWLMDERKEIVLKYLHFMFGFLTEFSKRSGINVNLLSYALIDEIPLVLERNFEIEELERRRSGSLWVTEFGDRISYITGNDAAILKKKLLENKISDKNEELRGNVANRGESAGVIGTARVILNAKDQTIGNDEILVTSMTRPEFVPLMRKAKAIVTNEGGITCHAAIISRELNIPCIIGTKHATESLNDGDLIELRMNHGAIKILKRNK